LRGRVSTRPPTPGSCELQLAPAQEALAARLTSPKGAPWQAARRPFRDEPHEYAIRGRGELDPEQHDAFLQHIEQHGYRESYEGRTYTYLDLDGHTYWASRGIYQPHRIINRRRSKRLA
jgi:hypothetical protein